MALTKANAALTWASGSATATGVTNAVDVSASYASTLYVKIVVAGTASTAASFQVLYSPDSSTYYNSPTYTAGTAAASYYWVIAIPADAGSFEISYTAQSGGTSSTLTAQVGKVTAV